MFDANAAHIPVGQKFFAEVHSTNDELLEYGIKRGDIILCEHVLKEGVRERDNVDTFIWTNTSEEGFHFNSKASEGWCWLVYSGRPNGKGFICEEWKQKALDFLGGEWNA